MQVVSSLKVQFEEDTRALFQFLVRKDPLPPSHVRIVTSGIVRRWLIDNQLNQLAKEIQASLTLPILDTKIIVDAISAGAEVTFFMAGGIYMDGVPMRGIYMSELPFEERPTVPIDSMDWHDITPKQFLKARRVYHLGEWFNTEQIIRFMANKCGGVHFDRTRKYQWEVALEGAAEFFRVGNPDNLDERQLIETQEPKRGILLVLPKEAGHVWSCLDIELLAAAQSLVNVRCNGKPLIEFARAHPCLLVRNNPDSANANHEAGPALEKPGRQLPQRSVLTNEQMALRIRRKSISLARSFYA